MSDNAPVLDAKLAASLVSKLSIFDSKGYEHMPDISFDFLHAVADEDDTEQQVDVVKDYHRLLVELNEQSNWFHPSTEEEVKELINLVSAWIEKVDERDSIRTQLMDKRIPIAVKG